MPRYFFNTRIGDELIVDPEGEELRSADRAWEVARTMILELMRTEGATVLLLNAVIEVTGDDGEIVLEFPFSEAVLDLPDEPLTRHGYAAEGVAVTPTLRSIPPRPPIDRGRLHHVSDCARVEKYNKLKREGRPRNSPRSYGRHARGG